MHTHYYILYILYILYYINEEFCKSIGFLIPPWDMILLIYNKDFHISLKLS